MILAIRRPKEKDKAINFPFQIAEIWMKFEN